MACCVAMAAILAVVMGAKAALFGTRRGGAQAWRLPPEEGPDVGDAHERK